MSNKLINIEVAYALPTKQTIIDVAIHENATVEEAINASNVLEQFPEIDLKATKVGIWSRVVKLRDTLTDGDRIEIYLNEISFIFTKEHKNRRITFQANQINEDSMNPTLFYQSYLADALECHYPK